MEDKLYNYLAQFDFLSPQEVAYIVAQFTPKHLKKNELLVRAGSICDQLAFIATGAVRAFTSDENGEDNTTCFSFENRFVTVFDSFIARKSAQKSIRAIEDCTLLVINNNTFQQLATELPSWIYLQELLTREAFAEKEYYHIHFKNKAAKEKYRHLLEEQPEIIKRAEVQDIASYLGITQRTLTRAKRAILYPEL